MGNRNGILEAQLELAKKNPNIIMEFKTKQKILITFYPLIYRQI